MTGGDRPSRRGQDYESPGTVDYPFDSDRRNPAARGFESDAACTIPWRAGGYEAIQVFVDPALLDRAEELCGVVEQWAGTNRDIDSLAEAVERYSETEDVSGSVYEDAARDDLSTGTLAIAFTLG